MDASPSEETWWKPTSIVQCYGYINASCFCKITSGSSRINNQVMLYLDSDNNRTFGGEDVFKELRARSVYLSRKSCICFFAFSVFLSGCEQLLEYNEEFMTDPKTYRVMRSEAVLAKWLHIWRPLVEAIARTEPIAWNSWGELLRLFICRSREAKVPAKERGAEVGASAFPETAVSEEMWQHTLREGGDGPSWCVMLSTFPIYFSWLFRFCCWQRIHVWFPMMSLRDELFGLCRHGATPVIQRKKIKDGGGKVWASSGVEAGEDDDRGVASIEWTSGYEGKARELVWGRGKAGELRSSS
ncbi:hypothetical protein GOP47_0024664 [Adiantum capillus-veneris]|uniref:Uncharacterized protein n=1 Tax=Adiantum capillus-veneris TaxID=13818 RepID=A0A9D4U282_ADICA|nr:hypothetical protein GOP47_0024664 [Adiantum capillus-veneris]